MSTATIVKIVLSAVVIAAGEALKLQYTDWAQLTGLQYWAGIIVQTGAAYGLLRTNSNGGAVKPPTADDYYIYRD
jgi:hypothetical protein